MNNNDSQSKCTSHIKWSSTIFQHPKELLKFHLYIIQHTSQDRTSWTSSFQFQESYKMEKSLVFHKNLEVEEVHHVGGGGRNLSLGLLKISLYIIQSLTIWLTQFQISHPTTVSSPWHNFWHVWTATTLLMASVCDVCLYIYNLNPCLFFGGELSQCGNKNIIECKLYKGILLWMITSPPPTWQNWKKKKTLKKTLDCTLAWCNFLFASSLLMIHERVNSLAIFATL